MANPMISLRIAGTKQRQAGFVPLATVGVLAGNEGDNMDRVTMVAEKPAYIVKHAADYILYGLIDRQVKSFDADAPGVLSIALTIPSNMQLANNVSPFRLIQDIYEKFLITYMERLSDGRDSFVNVDCDSDLFRKMLNQYSLEERKSVYIKMNPQGMTGIVCVSPNDLEDFFRNTQYKEFASFKDIEVGVSCQRQVSMGLERLQIPLPQAAYDVYVNNKPTGATLYSPTDSYCANDQSTNEYSYESVEFTLGELIAAPQNRISRNGASISLDFQTNRILCHLKKVEVYYTFVYEWTDNVGDVQNIIESYIKSKNIRLYFGKEDVSLTLFKGGQVKASMINGRTIDIDPKVVGSYSLYALSDIDHVKHQINTRIIINKRAIPATQNPGRPSQHNKVPVATPVNNSIGSDDYFKRGERQTGTTTNAQKEKGTVFDIKSFAVGVLVGLIIGIGIWFVYSLFSDDSSKKKGDSNSQAPVAKVDSPVGSGSGRESGGAGQDKGSDQNQGSESQDDVEPATDKNGYNVVDNKGKENENEEEEKKNKAIVFFTQLIITNKDNLANLNLDYVKSNYSNEWNDLGNSNQLIVAAVLDPKGAKGPQDIAKLPQDFNKRVKKRIEKKINKNTQWDDLKKLKTFVVSEIDNQLKLLQNIN